MYLRSQLRASFLADCTNLFGLRVYQDTSLTRLPGALAYASGYNCGSIMLAKMQAKISCEAPDLKCGDDERFDGRL